MIPADKRVLIEEKTDNQKRAIHYHECPLCFFMSWLYVMVNVKRFDSDHFTRLLPIFYVMVIVKRFKE